METVVELRGLVSDRWFEELTGNLPGAVALGDLSELYPPPGTFGASKTSKFKARLQTTAQIAGVLSAAATLYHAGFAGEADRCKFTFHDGTTQVELVVPCDSAHSPGFVTSVNGALAKLHGSPSAITVDPIRTPAQAGTRDAGQP